MWPTGTPVYVARPYVLGNPFTIGKDGHRAAVLYKYDMWLEGCLEDPTTEQSKALRTLKAILDLGDLVLVCWCYPLQCHCDILRKKLEAM